MRWAHTLYIQSDISVKTQPYMLEMTHQPIMVRSRSKGCFHQCRKLSKLTTFAGAEKVQSSSANVGDLFVVLTARQKVWT